MLKYIVKSVFSFFNVYHKPKCYNSSFWHNATSLLHQNIDVYVSVSPYQISHSSGFVSNTNYNVLTAHCWWVSHIYSLACASIYMPDNTLIFRSSKIFVYRYYDHYTIFFYSFFLVARYSHLISLKSPDFSLI